MYYFLLNNFLYYFDNVDYQNYLIYQLLDRLLKLNCPNCGRLLTWKSISLSSENIKPHNKPEKTYSYNWELALKFNNLNTFFIYKEVVNANIV